MNKDKITELFAEMLSKHDWTYEYTDDHKRYLRGLEQRKEILNFMDEYSQYEKLLTEMYIEANPFNNNRTII